MSERHLFERIHRHCFPHAIRYYDTFYCIQECNIHNNTIVFHDALNNLLLKVILDKGISLPESSNDITVVGYIHVRRYWIGGN